MYTSIFALEVSRCDELMIINVTFFTTALQLSIIIKPYKLYTMLNNNNESKLKLEGYSCKQLLKDSYSNFTVTLKVNTH